MDSAPGWNWSKVSGTHWSVPSEDVYYFLHRWRERGLLRLLDLGCGIGRHSLLFAEHGYGVTAADVSESGLRRLAASTRQRGLSIATKIADVTSLPFEVASFDAVLAYHSIYHVDSGGMRRAIGEVQRVLRPGGELYMTMISKKAHSYTDPSSRTIDASVRLKMEEDGTVLPHFYVDDNDIRLLLAEFTILRMRHIEDFYDGGSGCHYFVHAAKPGGDARRLPC